MAYAASCRLLFGREIKCGEWQLVKLSTHIVVQMSESLNTKNSHSLNKAHTNIVVTFPGPRIRGIHDLVLTPFLLSFAYNLTSIVRSKGYILAIQSPLIQNYVP